MSNRATTGVVLITLILVVAHAAAPARPPGALPAAALMVQANDAALVALEPQLRVALADYAVVLDAARTAELVSQASGLGLSCAVVDERCAGGLVDLAGVDDVLLLSLERVGSSSLLRAARIGKHAPMHAAGRVDAAAAIVASLYTQRPSGAPVPVHVTVAPSDAAVVVDNVAVALEGGTIWVQPGRRAFEARAGGMASRVVLEIPADGRITDVDLAVSVPSGAGAADAGGNAHGRDATGNAHAIGDNGGRATPKGTGPGERAEENAKSITGGSIAGAGVLIGGIGGALWLVMNDALGQPMHPDERALLSMAGVGGAGLVIVGIGGVVTGAYWVSQ